jgi:hypothetical protein
MSAVNGAFSSVGTTKIRRPWMVLPYGRDEKMKTENACDIIICFSQIFKMTADKIIYN